MQEVDFFVIGAGIAGLTFYRYLESDSVVIADFHPGRYKIGESIIPQHFFQRELRPLLAEARKLPSAAAKIGTMFVTDEAVSLFRAYFDGDYTVHLDRQELEKLYRETFDVPILEERVVDIDFERKIVRTTTQAFHVRRQIVDCSGPAMVVARRLQLAYELWPAWASWAYWDIVERRDERFWNALRAKGTPFLCYDDAAQKILPAEIDPTARATETTMLTRWQDGVWTWQIPLYQASMLSFGVVTRHGPVERERYLEIARASLGAQYEARMRDWSGDGAHNRFHRRDRFAWAARTFASPDWLLIGDAAFFGDPVYSVGTGIATNQAIRAAELINRFGWEGGAWKAYERRTAEIFERAKAAYQHWYAGEVTTSDDVARKIQVGFLNGLDLHFGTNEAYMDMWHVSAPEDSAGDPRYGDDPSQHVENLPLEVFPEDVRGVGDFQLSQARSSHGVIELLWALAGKNALTMRVSLRDARRACFQAAGPFALFSGTDPQKSLAIDARGRALFEAFARVLTRHQPLFLSLIENGSARERRPGGWSVDERTRQLRFELQLGHLCNDRCVFCVSGQLTRKGMAPILETQTLLEQLRKARARGARTVVLIGGEPTIQPGFLDVVREAVAIGFDEIVIFSNGSKLGRTDLIERVLETGGRFEWRLSFQGATREAHERTTRRKGSFAQVERTLRELRARGQKVTINTCVVTTNAASLPEFPALLLPQGVSQLHVDMLNPYDTGAMADEELRAIQPRYSDLAEPLAQMIAGFPDGFDVNIGNLPYCIAPLLSPWIHHGGPPTWTVTADDFGGAALQPRRNKYLVKGSRKIKAPTCAECLLDARCDGVFDLYTRWNGTSELVPLTAERLSALDPERRLLALHLRPLLRSALAKLPSPFESCLVDEHDLRKVSLHFAGGADGPQLVLALRSGRGGIAATDRFACDVVVAKGDAALLTDSLVALFRSFAAAGERLAHAPGADAFSTRRTLALAYLARLRRHAPFGALSWVETRLRDGERMAEVVLESPSGERATLWIGERGGRVSGGYRLDDPGAHVDASDALIEGLRQAMAALREAPATRGPDKALEVTSEGS